MGQQEQPEASESEKKDVVMDQPKEQEKSRRRSQFSENTLFDMPFKDRPKTADDTVQAPEAELQAEVEDKDIAPGVTRDNLSVVTRVVYPDNSAYEFTYSAGEVSKMVLTSRSGKVSATWLKSTDGYKEHRPDQEGTATVRTWRGELTVDQESGDVVFRPKFSRLTITERAADGMAVSENKQDGWAVSRTRDGRVKRVDYTGGSFRVFDYDEQGLIQIVEDDRISYTRQVDGTWVKLDKSTSSSEICREKFLVTTRGDLIVQGAGYQVSQRPEGTRIGCEQDAQGHLLVKIVSHPLRGEYQFGYDDDGRLLAVVWPDGTTDSRQGPGVWRRRAPGEVLHLEQQVDTDGNLIAIGNTGVVEVVRPDGSAVIEYPNGTREEHDRAGVMVWKITPGQREIRWNVEDERYEYQGQEGDTWVDFARDHLRAIDGNAKYEPARDEVAQEVQRLLKVNGLQEASDLEAGTKIKLYE